MLTLLAVVTLALWIAGGGEVALGGRKVGFLRAVEPPSDRIRPRVSVIVAARNEAKKIRAAVETLLRQSGIEGEVIAVDDRSDDSTGEILDALAVGSETLRVVHIGELPEGWLGKTHALHAGAAAAQGEWLLFTDADVVFGSDSIAKAVEYARRHGLHHLAVTPELSMPNVPADLFGGVFVLLFSRYARPWKARDPRSRAHIGIGAFNLVRRDAYDAIGGHAAVRLRPDDDMRLGRAIKRAGLRQDVLYGTDEVRVEWYGSLGESIRGLEKNAFAGLRYSVAAVLAAVGAILTFSLWPWAAVWVTEGAVRWLNLASVFVMMGLYVESARASGTRAWLAPLFPVGVLAICYAVVRSAWLAVRRGRIRWRETSYALDDLRRFDG